jgi:hypothetical protein
VDLQREEFYGRVARIEECRGSDPSARRRKAGAGLSGGRWIAPLGMVLASIVAMKAVVHANIGPESYDHKIAVLAAGDVVDRAGAWVLAADPLTVKLSDMTRALALELAN